MVLACKTNTLMIALVKETFMNSIKFLIHSVISFVYPFGVQLLAYLSTHEPHPVLNFSFECKII